MTREPSQLSGDLKGPKCSVEMTLNEELVRRARALTGDLSEQVERLLVAYVRQCEKHHHQTEQDRIDAVMAAWNAFDQKHGAFADDYIDL